MTKSLKEIITEKIDKIKDLRTIINIAGIKVPSLYMFVKNIIDNEDALLAERLETIDNEYQEELKDNEYKQLRANEYPSWEEVQEALIENMEGRPEKLTIIKKKRTMVRDKHPKPRK